MVLTQQWVCEASGLERLRVVITGTHANRIETLHCVALRCIPFTFAITGSV